jgi:hypothetical protein
MFSVLSHLKELVMTLSRENADTHSRTIKQVSEQFIFQISRLVLIGFCSLVAHEPW